MPTSAAVELETVLLEAKLAVPDRRPGTVDRGSLIETARSTDCRLVAVTAPAGYGKSTLLTEWAETEGRPVAWVSLDRFDNDPATLLLALASAYARISGQTSLVADMRGLGVSALGRAAPRLAAALRTSPFSFVLVLDELDEVENPAALDALGLVLAGIPRGSQAVVASRSAPLQLSWWRASGDLVELGASDLALDAAGTQQIFAAARVDLSPELAEAVTVRAEGWPAGLYLAAVIAREGRQGALAITGEDRYVADYLYRESLLQLPESLQQFLRRTAVLDQLHAPLCDAILEETGSDARLRDLEARSLFVIPLDRHRSWFRYHALFREFLLGELRRVEPDIVSKLHLRAADWYETNGSPTLAVEHLLSTPERERCSRLVSALVLPTYQSGQLSTVQRWLAALGRPALEDYPPLAVSAGWVASLSGETAAAQRWADFLDTATFDALPVDGTASFESARAMLRALMCPHGPVQMSADASFAVDQEPAWSAWRGSALALRAESMSLLGDYAQADELFVAAYDAATTLGNVNVVAISKAQLAETAMDRGHWSAAAEHVRVALTVVDNFRLHDYVLAAPTNAAAARLALHREDRAEADRQLTRAMRARSGCTFVIPWLAVRLRLQLAKLHVSVADQATARHLMREIDDIVLQRPDLGTLLDEVRDCRQSLTTRPHQAVGATGPPLSAAELRLLPYLQTHLTFREIGERLFLTRNTISSEVGSIYRKLGVSSRSEAVDRAMTIGLLGN